MALTQLAIAPEPLHRTVDAIRECADRLEAALPAREDCEVLVDFIEDDLREGLDAIADVEAHFSDVVEALRDEKLSPVRLVDLADDLRVLNKLEYLMVLASQLRRRLTLAAGKLHSVPRGR